MELVASNVIEALSVLDDDTPIRVEVETGRGSVALLPVYAVEDLVMKATSTESERVFVRLRTA